MINMFTNKKTEKLPETRSSGFNLIADGNGRCTTSRSLALPEHQPEVKLISYEKSEAITD